MRGLKDWLDLASLLRVHVGFVKFGYSEKATKFEKIFHLKFDIPE